MFKALDATQGCRACLPCAPQYKAGGTLLPTGHIASMEDREEGEDASCTGGRFSASAGQSLWGAGKRRWHWKCLSLRACHPGKGSTTPPTLTDTVTRRTLWRKAHMMRVPICQGSASPESQGNFIPTPVSQLLYRALWWSATDP